MGKHKYFELAEFINSATAKKKGIDNTPSFEVVQHLDELVTEILDPLREAWGKAIIVTCGYRCQKLNAAVGGVATSAHLLGYAADLQVKGSFDEFKTFVVDWFKKTGKAFDQLIVETDKKGVKWIHIGLKNKDGKQRRQILNIAA